jgi:hypothetical protein
VKFSKFQIDKEQKMISAKGTLVLNSDFKLSFDEENKPLEALANLNTDSEKLSNKYKFSLEMNDGTKYYFVFDMENLTEDKL